MKFSGAPEIDPFLQRFCRKSSIWGSKVQVFDPSVRHVLTPLSRSPRKNALRTKASRGYFLILALRGILGGSFKITSEIINNFQVVRSEKLPQIGHFKTAHETTTATKLRFSSVPIQPPEVPKSGNDCEMTTSPPGHP